MDSPNNFDRIEILGVCLICGRPYGDVDGLVHVKKNGEYDFKAGNHGVMTPKNKKNIERCKESLNKNRKSPLEGIRSVYYDRYRDFRE